MSNFADISGELNLLKLALLRLRAIFWNIVQKNTLANRTGRVTHCPDLPQFQLNCFVVYGVINMMLAI